MTTVELFDFQMHTQQIAGFVFDRLFSAYFGIIDIKCTISVLALHRGSSKCLIHLTKRGLIARELQPTSIQESN